MNDVVSMNKIIGILRKKALLIFSITATTMVLAAIFSFYVINPIYQSTAQILVSQEQGEAGGINNQNLQTDLQLINTYNVIIRSPFILDKVIDKLGINASAEELYGNITVNSASESQVINISVKDENPAVAVEIANMTVEVFQAEIRNLMKVDNVSILSPAVLKENPTPIEPNPIVNIVIAAVIGGMSSVGLAFLLAYLDTSIKNEQDIEELLGVPVLAIISPMDKKEKVSKDESIVLKEKEA